jgi:secreted trypsin-like serine protease
MPARAPRGRSSIDSRIKKLVLALSFVTLYLTSPFSSAQGNRPDVVPGEKSCIQRIPWQVGLEINTTRLCGGVLISPTWVATAAHCVVRKDANTGAKVVLDPNRIRTFMGKTRRSLLTSGDYRAVKKVIVHESFINGNDGDIAILELDGAFPEANVIPIATSDQMQQHWVANSKAVVSGWGITSSGTTADDLREETVNFVSISDCSTNPRLTDKVTERMVCAGDAGRDSCFGDSGGPLSLAISSESAMAIGIVSFGAPNTCGERGVPGVYTRLSDFKDWITRHTGSLPTVRQALGTCTGHAGTNRPAEK